MRPSQLFNTRGTTATQYAIARAVSKITGDNDAEYARKRWGGSTPIIRAAVGGGGFADSDGWGSELALPDSAVAEFVGLVNEVSVFGILSATMRKAPINTRIPAQASRLSAGFVGAGQLIPMSPAAFDPIELPALKIGALTVISDELARDSSGEAESIIRLDLAQSIAEATDAQFLSPAEAAQDGFQPGSITNLVSPITSAGDPVADVRELITNFPGNLARAYFVTSPTNAAHIGLYRDAAGNYPFPGCGPRGGDILGVPVIASQNCPVDSDGQFLALVDPSGIAYADDGLEFAASKEGSIVQSSVPEGGSPRTSLFQSDSTALKSIRRINWRTCRACITWTWADYVPASS